MDFVFWNFLLFKSAMSLYAIIFYIIAALIVISTALAVTRRNLVHVVLYLVLSFFGSAMLFYLLGAPFLAALEIIIYAGAIMVLFLFIIMMIRVEKLPGMFFPVRQLVPSIFISSKSSAVMRRRFRLALPLIDIYTVSEDARPLKLLPAALVNPRSYTRRHTSKSSRRFTVYICAPIIS